MLRWFAVTAVLLAPIGLFPTAALAQTASLVLRELRITPQGEQHFRSFAGIPQTFIPEEDRNFVVNPPTDAANRRAKVTAVIDYTFEREMGGSGVVFSCIFTLPEFPDQSGLAFVTRLDAGEPSGNAIAFTPAGGEMILSEGIERVYTFDCRIRPGIGGPVLAKQEIVVKQTYQTLDTIRILSVDPPPTEPLAPEFLQTFVAKVEYTRDVFRLGGHAILVASDAFGNELIPRTDRRSNGSAELAFGDGPNPVEIELTLADVPIPLDGFVVLHAEQVNGRQFAEFKSAEFATYTTSEPVIYGEPPGVDFSIWHIEAIQVVQDDDNLIPLVADKKTVLRVYARTPVLPERQEGEGTEELPLEVIMRNGGAERRVATQVLPLRAPMGEKPHVSLRLARRLSAEIPVPDHLLSPGTLEVEATVNLEGGEPFEPEAGVENNTLDQEFTLHERDTLAIGYLDLVRCPEPKTKEKPCKKNASMSPSFLAKVFPVSPKKGLAHIPLGVPTNPNATGLTILLEAASVAANGLVDVLVVWIPPKVALVVTVTDKLVFALSNGRSIVISDIPGTSGQKFLAARVAENFLGDQDQLSCAYADDAEFNAVGWDSDSWRLLDLFRQKDLTTRCVANSPRNLWISASRYARLFLRNFTFFPPTASVKEETPAKLQSTGDLMIIAGEVNQDGSATLAPSVKLTGLMGDELSWQGQYCLDLGGGGVDGLRHCFTPDFSEVSALPFAFIFPYDAGLSGVSLSRDGIEIASLDASPGAPAVAVTTPAAGAQLDAASPVTISWTASDPDGDELIASVFYSFDGGAAWLPLRTGIAAESMTFDASTIHGGDNVHFRVSVSDGLRSAESSAGPLTLLQRPEVSVPRTADAGESAVGISRPVSISLEASGTGVLRIEAISSDDSAFVPASSLPIQLVAGTTGDILVDFNPPTPGNHQASLTLTTNAPGNETVQVQLAGVGLDRNQGRGVCTSLPATPYLVVG